MRWNVTVGCDLRTHIAKETKFTRPGSPRNLDILDIGSTAFVLFCFPSPHFFHYSFEYSFIRVSIVDLADLQGHWRFKEIHFGSTQ